MGKTSCWLKNESRQTRNVTYIYAHTSTHTYMYCIHMYIGIMGSQPRENVIANGQKSFLVSVIKYKELRMRIRSFMNHTENNGNPIKLTKMTNLFSQIDVHFFASSRMDKQQAVRARHVDEKLINFLIIVPPNKNVRRSSVPLQIASLKYG